MGGHSWSSMSTARVSLRKYFIPGCVGKGLDLGLRIRPAAPAPAAASKNLDFFKPHFFAGFWKIGTGQMGGIFKTPFVAGFWKRRPEFFQKSQISKISSSSHSKNAHIKLIGFQWVFGGWGDTPFIFFMGWMGQKSKNGPSRAVYPPGWGVI